MTAQTAEPTPRPYLVHGRTIYALVDDPTWFKDGKMQQVNRFSANVQGGGSQAASVAEQEATAAFIWRACNAHDDLVAALNHLAAAVAEMAGRGTNLPAAVERAIDEAGAVLAKVRP